MYAAFPYGTAFYAQSGSFPPVPVPASRTLVGGCYGTATYGTVWYGVHIQGVVPAPPIPPGPEPEDEGGGRRSGRRRIALDRDVKRDDEEIAMILGIWLNLPK